MLNFNPYQVSEIIDIIKDRLFSLNDENTIISPCKRAKKGSDHELGNRIPLMQPMAIELAARKIADTGDLRKALDVCR